MLRVWVFTDGYIWVGRIPSTCIRKVFISSFNNEFSRYLLSANYIPGTLLANTLVNKIDTDICPSWDYNLVGRREKIKNEWINVYHWCWYMERNKAGKGGGTGWGRSAVFQKVVWEGLRDWVSRHQRWECSPGTDLRAEHTRQRG